jgi:UPF0716 protein FxsA
MSVLHLLFLAFLLIPLVEIYVLIQVGGLIGALPTVLAVVGTAVLGATLIRAQGLTTFARMRGAMDRGEVPAVEMLEAACLLVAGALLLTPGFVTDAIGFALLLPPLRRTAVVGLLERTVVRHARAGPSERGSVRGTVIEGEYRREEPPRAPEGPPKRP